MGKRINDLTRVKPAASQLVPVYDPSSDDTRAWSVDELKEFFEDSITTLESIDSLYLLGQTEAEGTGRVSWDALKANLLGDYILWPHDIPGTTDEIVSLMNGSLADVFTVLELRAPGNSATLESTLALHNYSAALGEDWVRDVSMHNYDGDMRAYDVISNFTNATRGKWDWWSKAIDDGVAVLRFCARIDGDSGDFSNLGNILPMETDAQNLGNEDLIWSNAFVGYVKAAAVKVTGSYRFDDGTTVFTGATGTFTTANGKTVTVKGGIITAIV